MARRDLALGAGAPLFYEDPVEIVRGEGAYLFDRGGKRYVDLYNNVPCVGHGNPAVAAAMARQQSTLNVHSRYLHEGIVAFAERLAALHHPGIESCVFACSGTEANDVALAMARSVTGKHGIVCTDKAYHGSSGASGSLTHIGNGGVAGRDSAGFPFPDMYRMADQGLAAAQITEQYIAAIEAAIDFLEADGQGFAGLIVCPIFANEGLTELPAGLLGLVTDLVHRRGGLMISDEVQSGYGRTGHWWGYEYMGFFPDIAVTGKPMGNGLPLAATAASRAHIECFRRATGYFNTFASTPLQAAVGMTVIDEIERLELLHNARVQGEALYGALKPYEGTHPLIGSVRAYGLFLSMEVVRDSCNKTPFVKAAHCLANALKDAGCLLSVAGAYDNVVKVRPPLVFGDAHREEFLRALSACMSTLAEDVEGFI